MSCGGSLYFFTFFFAGCEKVTIPLSLDDGEDTDGFYATV